MPVERLNQMSQPPPEIIELTFEEPLSVSQRVRALLETIEHYRSQGRSLRDIYNALIAGEHLSDCRWRTFEKTYYRIRKEPSPQVRT